MEQGNGALSVLAIDTAARSRTVVVVATPEGERIQGVVLRGDTVGASLPAALKAVLPIVEVAVVVVTGPGTYTGVRAGMAGALGIAQAKGLPLHGIGALEVVAAWPHTGADGDPWVVADAGRGALYVARRSTAASPQRLAAAAFHDGGAGVLSTETLAIDSLVIDPAEALAHAVVLALSRPRLDLAGLTALYTE